MRPSGRRCATGSGAPADRRKIAAMKGPLLAVLLLAGCSSHTAWHASVGQPHPNAQVQINGGAALATVVGISILAAGVYDHERGGAGFATGDQRRVPEMAPDRKVSEQDCTKPLDYTLGNIRCK